MSEQSASYLKRTFTALRSLQQQPSFASMCLVLLIPVSIHKAPKTLLCVADQNLPADGARGYSDKARTQAQRLGRPPSSQGAVLLASTWFDEVAALRMQQMCIVQKDAVKIHDQALDQQVQGLTVALAQASSAASWLYLLCCLP